MFLESIRTKKKFHQKIGSPARAIFFASFAAKKVFELEENFHLGRLATYNHILGGGVSVGREPVVGRI